MPEFAPFTAVRYDTSRVELGAVTAPPYSAVTAELRDRLLDRHPYNVVRLDLPADEPARDRYEAAGCLLDEWLQSGVLRRDPEPAFYGYRMTTPAGARVTGVIGALALSPPEEGWILPHEHTLATHAEDRLRMLRACRANLSPIWGLVPTAGLRELALAGELIGTWRDDDVVDHELRRIVDPTTVAAISALVGPERLVIADGHHRYETALVYRDERRAVDGAGSPADQVLTFVVALDDDALPIGPLHRLVDLPPGTDPVESLRPHLDLAAGPLPPPLPVSAPTLVTARGSWSISARTRDDRMLDAALADDACGWMTGADVRYEPVDLHAIDAVRSGRADAAILVRPVSLDRIDRLVREGVHLPAKTTSFRPKPSTGAVFRLLRP